jgi:hypothetical protein
MRALMNVCGKQIRVQGQMVRIGRLDLDKYECPDDPEAMIQGLRNCRTRIDLFTFLQKLPESSPRYGYPMEWDNLAALPVSTFDYWWKQQIRSYPRNRARQAEKKGVIVREVSFDDALVRGIWGIYNECPVRQGKRFAHYGKDIETVHKEEATYLDRSIFIGAFLDAKLIGFAKLVADGTRTQANLMNVLAMMHHRDKAPTNALIAQAVRSCAERGIAYLVYQSFAYGRKESDTLSTFKENNGFQRFDLPRYYVPLTRIGSIALRLGLHRRLVDHLPESVAAKLRQLREVCYNHKFQSLMGAL